MKTLKYIYTIIAIASLIACSGSDDGGDTTPDLGGNGDSAPPPVTENEDTPGDNNNIALAKATLIFPDNGKVCTTGIFLENSTDSNVTFDWSDAENATSYEVTLNNTDASTTEKKVFTTSEGVITLKQDTNYSWTVSSIRGSNKVESDVFTFYNAAEGDKNSAPFPAKLTSPENSSTLATLMGTSLQWEASQDRDSGDTLS